MGLYLNPSSQDFEGTVTGEVYVDKSELIRFTNRAIGHPQDNRIVVSRPRRFGKTMAADMLAAYYSLGCDSGTIFKDMAIASDPSFTEHLNKHNVIHFDVQALYSTAIRTGRLNDFDCFVSEKINAELIKIFPDEVLGNEKDLPSSTSAIYAVHGVKFIFLLDEWDVIYREAKNNDKLKSDYTRLLRDLFKNSDNKSVDLVYMTGILPIPEQETQSGLSNFRESTMFNPGVFGKYIGFTQAEVDTLCEKWKMPVEEIKKWYDGYRFGSMGSIYCPASVVDALRNHEITDYWIGSAAATELFNVMSSKDPEFQKAVKSLLSGQPVLIDGKKKINFADLKQIEDALIALVHLGYLAYNKNDSTVYVPNLEVTKEFMNVLSMIKDNPTYEIIRRSRKLLEDTLNCNADAVASTIQKNHAIFCSGNTYNRESDLAQLIVFSYYLATAADYRLFRELPAGKGVADIAFIPKTQRCIPIIVELKYNEAAGGAIEQIRNRQYTAPFEDCSRVLLVGISYEKSSRKKKTYKKHTCVIELLDMNGQNQQS